MGKEAVHNKCMRKGNQVMIVELMILLMVEGAQNHDLPHFPSHPSLTFNPLDNSGRGAPSNTMVCLCTKILI